MNLFDRLNNLFSIVVGGFTAVWDALSMNVLDLLSEHGNAFTDFLVSLIESLSLADFFADVTLGGFIFGTSLLFLIVVFIIYVFIP